MSINSALIDLRIPAGAVAAESGNNAIAAVRRLVRRPAASRPRPDLKIGDSYRIPDRRHGFSGRSNWVHTRH